MINQPKLNLACGQIRIPGYFGIDLVKTENVDAQMDLQEFPWDIASDSAEDIICNHYVEHTPMDTLGDKLIRLILSSPNYETLYNQVSKLNPLAPNDGLILFMEEVYRILKVGGKIHITAPHFNNGVAWQDPTHRRAITEVTFNYFDKGWRDRSKLDHYPIKADMEARFEGYEVYPDMERKSPDEKKFSYRHLSNCIANLKVTLTKKPI